jgi:hypothetical protein
VHRDSNSHHSRRTIIKCGRRKGIPRPPHYSISTKILSLFCGGCAVLTGIASNSRAHATACAATHAIAPTAAAHTPAQAPTTAATPHAIASARSATHASAYATAHAAPSTGSPIITNTVTICIYKVVVNTVAVSVDKIGTKDSSAPSIHSTAFLPSITDTVPVGIHKVIVNTVAVSVDKIGAVYTTATAAKTQPLRSSIDNAVSVRVYAHISISETAIAAAGPPAASHSLPITATDAILPIITNTVAVSIHKTITNTVTVSIYKLRIIVSTALTANGGRHLCSVGVCFAFCPSEPAYH